MALGGEAKKKYQREYMREYMRRRRAKPVTKQSKADGAAPKQPDTATLDRLKDLTQENFSLRQQLRDALARIAKTQRVKREPSEAANVVGDAKLLEQIAKLKAENTKLKARLEDDLFRRTEERLHRMTTAKIAGKAMGDDLFRRIAKGLHEESSNASNRLQAIKEFTEWARHHVPGQMKKRAT
jgi:hypothetical protein